MHETTRVAEVLDIGLIYFAKPCFQSSQTLQDLNWQGHLEAGLNRFCLDIASTVA